MPDDYLTVGEVAARLALPLEMIQRRIESGDIPVHWVEIGGKLEMRISAAEIGVDQVGGDPTPFPTPGAVVATESGAGTEEEVAPSSWSIRESQYESDVWATAPSHPPAAAAPPPPTPWETAVEDESDLPIGGGETAEPVWRSDPGSWEDEPLEVAEADDSAAELAPFSSPTAESYFPLDEVQAEFPAPPLPAATGPFSPGPDLVDEDEEEPPFGSDVDDDEEILDVVEESLDLEPSPPRVPLGVSEMIEVPRPSALAAAQGPDSALAINSIDARELVAGLFERWERALEQRIQAEQRLRFEAELERRLRQVRDLRQELENTRKSTAAQLAEREQEVLALRAKLREKGPDQPKGRSLFRR